MSMLTSFKVSSLAKKCMFYRPEHNAKGIELNFEGLNARMKYTSEQKWNSRWEKMGHLSSYHVQPQSYGH